MAKAKKKEEIEEEKMTRHYGDGLHMREERKI